MSAYSEKRLLQHVIAHHEGRKPKIDSHTRAAYKRWLNGEPLVQAYTPEPKKEGVAESRTICNGAMRVPYTAPKWSAPREGSDTSIPQQGVGSARRYEPAYYED